MSHTKTQLWARYAAFFTLLTCLLSACSVNEKSNPQRINCDECKARRGKCITNKFCLLPVGPPSEAGMDAASGEAGPSQDAGGAITMDAHVAPPDPDAAMEAGVDASSPRDALVGEACPKKGATELCYSGKDLQTALQPPCHAGSRTCDNGVWGECKGESLPSVETCNGVDDDCDSKTDEGEARDPHDCTVESASVKGECRQGVALCRGGKVDCVQVVMPSSDVCNGLDDDCDGNTDEATAVKCYEGTGGCTSNGMNGFTCVGICAAGAKACVNGIYTTTCAGSVVPQASEVCSSVGQDPVDENCNGHVDEGCPCTNGQTYRCYSGSPMTTQDVLPCKRGDRLCSNDMLGETCTGEVTPHPETCANQGVDNDCNGTVDDIPLLGTSCSEMSTGKGLCKAQATWECSGGSTMCIDGLPATEICDAQGIDENCDAQSNEGFNLDNDVNNCGSCGNKCATGATCCGGSCVDTRVSNLHCGSCVNKCATGSTCCSSNCKATNSDNNNCGTCGNVCGALNGCKNGTCTLLNL